MPETEIFVRFALRGSILAKLIEYNEYDEYNVEIMGTPIRCCLQVVCKNLIVWGKILKCSHTFCPMLKKIK